MDLQIHLSELCNLRCKHCYQEDCNLNWRPRKNENFTKVQCVETGIVYNSIKEAVEQTGASSAIKRCIKNPKLKFHVRIS